MYQTVSETVAASKANTSPTLLRGLSLLDSVLLLVSGVIGSSVFLTANVTASSLPNPVLFLLVWVFGGLISLFACFAFAELGSMFPQSGGQYVYLREAYGPLPAFLYGWMIFAVSNGGTIAALAVASATYLGKVIPTVSQEHVVFTVGWIVLTRAHIFALMSIGFVTFVNVAGLRRGAILQNIATWAKFLAMAAFVLLGLTIGKGDWHHFAARKLWDTGGLTTMGVGPLLSGVGIALIAVFWAYDGWVYITWVGGEVKDSSRTVPRALVLGLLIVMGTYVALNATYLYAMPLSEIAKHDTIAQAAAVVLFSPRAAVLLSVMIALSSFGAMASCVMSGSRVYFAMARDGVFFHRMAEIHPKWRTPAFSLIGQGIWAGVLAISGRYDQLYTYVMFMMVLSYTLTVVALFVLRLKRPGLARSYRCTGYPWLPAIYVIVGTAWTLNTIRTRPLEAVTGSFIVLLGIPGYLYWKRASQTALAGRTASAQLEPTDTDQQ
jgi:APA family basic amino acid/polyamine antiporter